MNACHSDKILIKRKQNDPSANANSTSILSRNFDNTNEVYDNLAFSAYWQEEGLNDSNSCARNSILLKGVR